MMDKRKLRKGETGERANIKAVFEWVLADMDYNDFKRLARLQFYDHNDGYPFEYWYRVDGGHDSKEAREDYLKYLAYKLIQNLDTEGVELLNTKLPPRGIKL